MCQFHLTFFFIFYVCVCVVCVCVSVYVFRFKDRGSLIYGQLHHDSCYHRQYSTALRQRFFDDVA